MSKERLHLRLPATSANLGPGFDALALALTLYLEVEAAPAERYAIHASGRNADVCGALERNLLLHTYKTVLQKQNAAEIPLQLEVRNGIPLGMGCGSSAATRLAGVALASHFGGLGWDRRRILAEASRLEGHPDNTAACWLGGFTVACWHGDEVEAISLTPRNQWQAFVVMPLKPLATTISRKVVPEMFSRADVVANLQRVALLTAAFATGYGELLSTAVEDKLHQPYRAEVCSLLKKLLPLSGQGDILSVTLSGAGPSVLLLVQPGIGNDATKELVRKHADGEQIEILECGLQLNPALCRIERLTR
ncbi:homoserine kinase [Alloacidobacterium sp.]|uniref:homoserine kinase n=1 Tax=Alloacidobacterium sp. TaxID=2951999 RepID=UPI002D615FB3|nr:homoserine kinase [Alloacidobacterium sp.]HYK34549.1 homoserine kinase [Alloacidobacterium sp.]